LEGAINRDQKHLVAAKH